MFALVAAPASAAAPYCGIVWGSLAKGSSTMSTSPLVNIRSGRHTCYDRLVLDVAGKGVGYDVRYVSTFVADGSGFVVPARGGAKLQVVARVPANDVNTGRPTYDPANDLEVVNVAGYSTFRQVVWLNSFEGQTTVGLGVRARLPFRVFVLDGPGGGSRLVVDVAHHW
jgi:hypothetical protein